MARSANHAGLPLWLPIALIVAGLLGGAVPGTQLVIPLVRSAIDTFDAPVIDTPAEVGLELAADRYLVFERTGSTDAAGGGGFEVRTTRDGVPSLLPELVQVIEVSSGDRVPVTTCSCNETITKGEQIYHAALTFDVGTAGRHGVRIGGPPGEVIVTKSIADTIGDIGQRVPYVVLAAIVVAVGVALLVVVLVSRRRSA